MKRILGAVTLLSFAMVAVASSADAQDMGGTRSVNFGIAAGASFPSGSYGDFYDTGFNVMGTLGMQPASMPVGLRFDVAYNSFGSKGATMKVLSGTANAVLTTSNMNGVRPYVIGGVGLYNAKAGGDGDTKFGLNAGGGIEFPLSGFNTFAEVRYHSIFTDGDNFNYIPLVFGIKF